MLALSCFLGVPRTCYSRLLYPSRTCCDASAPSRLFSAPCICRYALIFSLLPWRIPYRDASVVLPSCILNASGTYRDASVFSLVHSVPTMMHEYLPCLAFITAPSSVHMSIIIISILSSARSFPHSLSVFLRTGKVAYF